MSTGRHNPNGDGGEAPRKRKWCGFLREYHQMNHFGDSMEAFGLTYNPDAYVEDLRRHREAFVACAHCNQHILRGHQFCGNCGGTKRYEIIKALDGNKRLFTYEQDARLHGPRAASPESHAAPRIRATVVSPAGAEPVGEGVINRLHEGFQRLSSEEQFEAYRLAAKLK